LYYMLSVTVSLGHESYQLTLNLFDERLKSTVIYLEKLVIVI